MKLYASGASPYVRKVRVFAIGKEVLVEHLAVDRNVVDELPSEDRGGA